MVYEAEFTTEDIIACLDLSSSKATVLKEMGQVLLDMSDLKKLLHAQLVAYMEFLDGND